MVKKFYIIKTLILILCGQIPHLQAAPTPRHAVLTVAQTKTIVAIESYLNSFQTLQARFTQILPDGMTTQGDFYLWRPGRMRLNYDIKASERGFEPHTIACNGTTMYDYYPALEELTEIPTDATPASFILRPQIHFSGDITITNFADQYGLYHLSLVKTDDPDAGTLTLIFNKNPITLVEWEVTDSQDTQTRVMLDKIKTDIQFEKNFFKVKF